MDLTEFTRRADRALRITTGRIDDQPPALDWGQLAAAFEAVFDTLAEMMRTIIDAVRAAAEAVAAFVRSFEEHLRQRNAPAFPGVEQSFVRLGRGHHQRGRT